MSHEKDIHDHNDQTESLIRSEERMATIYHEHAHEPKRPECPVDRTARALLFAALDLGEVENRRADADQDEWDRRSDAEVDE